MVWRGIALAAAFALAACSTSEPVVQSEVAAAPAPASVARGLAYAQQNCSGCHAVTAGQEASPNPSAPPFAVIANTPGMTPTALNAWLHSAHASMPNLIVAPEDRADIAASLESIRLGGGAS